MGYVRETAYIERFPEVFVDWKVIWCSPVVEGCSKEISLPLWVISGNPLNVTSSVPSTSKVMLWRVDTKASMTGVCAKTTALCSTSMLCDITPSKGWFTLSVSKNRCSFHEEEGVSESGMPETSPGARITWVPWVVDHPSGNPSTSTVSIAISFPLFSTHAVGYPPLVFTLHDPR